MYLRSSGLAADVEKLPPNSGWRAVHRRIVADLGRARATLPAFAAPEGWTIVGDVATLLAIGRAMQNCVAALDLGGIENMKNLVDGRALFFTNEGPPQMLALLQVAGPSLWTIGGSP